MSLLDSLSDEQCWEKFYEYKNSLACPKSFAKELRTFIDDKAYLPVCAKIAAGERFPLPRKAVISKMSSRKKRTVYIYPPAENIVLKLLTYLLMRRYDSIYSGNLYSFRPGKSAKDAIRTLTRRPGICQMYSYKADISNYFNTVPVQLLLPMLEEVTRGDPELFRFLSALLNEPRVLEHGPSARASHSHSDQASAPRGSSGRNDPANPNILTEQIFADGCVFHVTEEEKGIMAGTPLASFYANLYLRDLDRHFDKLGVPYARYSDDIILFAPTKEETENHAAYLRSILAERGLTLNPDKEHFAAPEDGWTFLGFCCKNVLSNPSHNSVDISDNSSDSGPGGISDNSPGSISDCSPGGMSVGSEPADCGSPGPDKPPRNYFLIDIAPATVTKLKKKMRRKARALRRWAVRNGIDGEKAAAAFIRVFNRKLFEGAGDNELTWTTFFFSVINTTDSLRAIDSYAQDCVRYIATGKHTKSRYNVRYEDMKKLGYRSLVHEYYAPRGDFSSAEHLSADPSKPETSGEDK